MRSQRVGHNWKTNTYWFPLFGKVSLLITKEKPERCNQNETDQTPAQVPAPIATQCDLGQAIQPPRSSVFSPVKQENSPKQAKVPSTLKILFPLRNKRNILQHPHKCSLIYLLCLLTSHPLTILLHWSWDVASLPTLSALCLSHSLWTPCSGRSVGVPVTEWAIYIPEEARGTSLPSLAPTFSQATSESVSPQAIGLPFLLLSSCNHCS